MIERIHGLPDGIDGVRCEGKLTREDYDAVVVPLLDAVEREHRGLRCLVEIDGFDGITPDAAFEDIRLGWQAMGSFEGCAVLTDIAWVGPVLRFVRLPPALPRAGLPHGPARRGDRLAQRPVRQARPSATACSRTRESWSSTSSNRSGSPTSRSWRPWSTAGSPSTRRCTGSCCTPARSPAGERRRARTAPAVHHRSPRAPRTGRPRGRWPAGGGGCHDRGTGRPSTGAPLHLRRAARGHRVGERSVGADTHQRGGPVRPPRPVISRPRGATAGATAGDRPPRAAPPDR